MRHGALLLMLDGFGWVGLTMVAGLLGLHRWVGVLPEKAGE